MTVWRWAPVLAAAGALQTLAYVHTAAWWLPLLTLALLAGWLMRVPGLAQAALGGWCYGLGWLCAGVWWLFVSMHRYGGLPAPLAVAGVVALSAFLSVYLAAACAAFQAWRQHQRAGALGEVVGFAAWFLLAELARGVLFTGFPWLALGYSQVDSPLAALAPWAGVYGTGAVAAAVAAAGALAVQRRGRDGTGLACLLIGAAGIALAWAGSAAGLSFTAPQGRLSVALIQTNVPQDQKFDSAHLPAQLQWLDEALREASADLVVAPETAMPLLPSQLAQLAPTWWPSLAQHFASAGQRAALVGVPLGDFDTGYTNSVVALWGGEPYRYDKFHLVPFGEFIPPGFRWFTDLMNIPLGDFARGVPNPPSLAWNGQRVAPHICYEDLFGEELARRFVDPTLAPTVLANVSNIGWFGQTQAVEQHLNISRWRALEFQVPVVRATNTGATAAIAHDGRVTAALAPHTRGVLQAEIQGRSGVTPFAWWAGRFGLWPLAAAALAVLVLPVAGTRVTGRRPHA